MAKTWAALAICALLAGSLTIQADAALGDSVTGAFHYVKDKVTGHHEEQPSKLADRIELARTCCRGCFDQYLADQMPDVGSATGEAWQNIKDKMAGQYEAVRGGAQSAAEQASGKASEAASKASEAARQASEAAGSTTDHYNNLFNQAWESVKGYVMGARESTGSAAEQAAAKAKEASAKGQEAAAGTYDQATGSASEAAGYAADKAREAGEYVKDTAAGAAGTVGQAASDAARKASDAAKGGANAVLHGVEKGSEAVRDTAETTRKKTAKSEL